MTTRQRIVQRWETGLEANDGPTDERAPFHWVRRVYVRIYRFLISRYGSGDWRADSEDAIEDSVELAASPMAYVDHTAEITGLEPKSAEQIRGKLAAIRDANEDRQPRGTTSGLADEAWVAVASCRKLKAANQICWKLRARGLSARQADRTTDHCIEVRYADFDEALDVLRQADRGAPLNRSRTFFRSRSRGIHLLTLLALTVTGFCCCVFAAMLADGATDLARRVPLLFISILCGCGMFYGLWPRWRR